MFAIGDQQWAGLSKLVEESGELLQICGKLMGSRGDTNHWSGDLRAKFVEELADVAAALDFFIDSNFTDEEHAFIRERCYDKFHLFHRWQRTDNDTLSEATSQRLRG